MTVGGTRGAFEHLRPPWLWRPHRQCIRLQSRAADQHSTASKRNEAHAPLRPSSATKHGIPSVPIRSVLLWPCRRCYERCCIAKVVDSSNDPICDLCEPTFDLVVAVPLFQEVYGHTACRVFVKPMFNRTPLDFSLPIQLFFYLGFNITII